MRGPKRKAHGALRGLLLPAAAILLLVQTSGTAPCQEKAAGAAVGKAPQVPDPAGDSCRTIAAILAVYPTLEVRVSSGAVRDPQGGPERSGCRVHASGPAAGLAGEVPPEEPIRFLLWESGWEEDARYAGTGPGAVSFALRKHGLLCRFAGDSPPGAEGRKVLPSRTYTFEAECAEEPDPG